MSAPKSVVKINKDGIKYESFEAQTEYYLFELSRAALRDVGKFIKAKWIEAFYNKFNVQTKDSKKATQYNVWSNAKTKYPRVDIGLRPKKGKGFYSYFQEFGSSKTPKEGILNKVVQDNIAEIVKIESQYLSGLSEEASRLEALINEGDYESND